jgi:hypothetical protein
MTIADLPFYEQPLRTLLHLEVDRDAPSRTFAGFGWARAERIWLEDAAGAARRIHDALVLALHTADDAEPIGDDLELELELPDGPVTVLASTFLARWLPKLPPAATIVLAICNPHRATLARPLAANVPVIYAHGEVASWRERDGAHRLILTAERWCEAA